MLTLVDNWLDRFIYMMVHMLAFDGALMTLRLLPFDTLLCIKIPFPLLLEAGFDFVGVVVFKSTMLNWHSVVMMLFGQDTGVLNGLLGGVIMVLMDLAVYSGCMLFVFLASDGLVFNGRIHLLVDCRVMFPAVRPTQIRISYVGPTGMVLLT